MPDATTLLKFRRLLEEYGLTASIFQEINAHLGEKGLLLREGTMVDATIIAAPPSTKNKDKARDPEMHQTKKGNAWHFGMKAHIGADVESGLVHSVHATSANESDVAHTHEVLHGQESVAHPDAGYTGVHKRAEIIEAQKYGAIRRDIHWQVAQRRHKLVEMPEGRAKEVHRKLDRLKAQVRARVEHPFHVVKNLLRHRKIRYKGSEERRGVVQPLRAGEPRDCPARPHGVERSWGTFARMKEIGAERARFASKTAETSPGRLETLRIVTSATLLAALVSRGPVCSAIP